MSGPFPADTLFVRAARGEFDVVIAAYHDQGLVPVKLLAFGRAVNVTLGLPIIRTSVDHGTAFDIARQGVADEGSLVEAILLAARCWRASQTWTGRAAPLPRLKLSAAHCSEPRDSSSASALTSASTIIWTSPSKSTPSASSRARRAFEASPIR